MRNQRTIAALLENLEHKDILSYDNILYLLDAYYYDCSSSIRSLLKALRQIHEAIQQDITIKYYDSDACMQTITKDTFKQFLLDHFDNTILSEFY